MDIERMDGQIDRDTGGTRRSVSQCDVIPAVNVKLVHSPLVVRRPGKCSER